MREGSTFFRACEVRCWCWFFGNKIPVSAFGWDQRPGGNHSLPHTTRFSPRFSQIPPPPNPHTHTPRPTRRCILESPLRVPPLDRLTGTRPCTMAVLQRGTAKPRSKPPLDALHTLIGCYERATNALKEARTRGTPGNAPADTPRSYENVHRASTPLGP